MPNNDDFIDPQPVSSLQSSELSALTKDVADRLYKLATEVTETVDPVVYGTGSAPLNVQLNLWVTLDYIKDIAEELSKMANKNLPIVAQRAEKLMTSTGMESVEYAGKHFTPDVKTFINVRKDDEPAIFNFMRANGAGELIRDYVHPKTFEKWVKESFLEKGKDLPPGVNAFDQPILKVRKARS